MPEHILSGIKAIVAMNMKMDGKTQREIGEYLKVDRSLVSHYLTGRHPSQRVLKVASDIIDMPIPYSLKIIHGFSDDKDLIKNIITYLYTITLKIDYEKCIQCGACLECKYGGIKKIDEYNIMVDSENCVLCCECIEICPINAIKIVNKKLEE